MERDYTLMLGVGTLLLAEDLTRSESNEERKHKKERVLERKRDMLREAFPEQTAGLPLKEDAKSLLEGKWPQDEAVTFIIDLAFTNPFAPYELRYHDDEMGIGLEHVGQLVGLDESDVQRIRRTQQEALRVHRHIDWARIALYGLGGLVLLGAGGWLVAPIVGGAIGVATGLSGAAATAHGLAILGGGSLALGGAGMAGGMWLATGAGAAIGVLATGGSTFLLQLGAATARIELIKLQVSYKEVILGTQMELKKAQEVIVSLTQQRDEIIQQIEQERRLNEANSARLKDMEETLEALEDSLEWMRRAYAEDTGEHTQETDGRQLIGQYASVASDAIGSAGETVSDAAALAAGVAGQAAEGVRDTALEAADKAKGVFSSISRRTKSAGGEDNANSGMSAAICSDCGAEVGPDYRFCPGCGQEVAAEKQCAACGKQIPIESAFCPQCGVSQI